MSTFNGILREYPLISIDQFLSENFSSTVFFLSHCHTDHMRGLSSRRFYEMLQKRSFSKIYMSKVSKIFLQNDDAYQHLSCYMESIRVEYPTTIIVPNDEGKEVINVVVTLLPAGHCPGSVMFLFEGINGTVLYTGDFRLDVGSTRRFNHLHYNSGRVKPISCLYLDTTFCDPKSLFIPTRQQCFETIFSLVHSWASRGTNYIIFLLCPANYGYEYVFISLYEKFGYKTHVKEEKYKKYKEIEEIREAVTTNASDAKIHPCWEGNCPEIMYDIGRTACGFQTADNQSVYVRRIKLSAMFYTSNIDVNDILVKRTQMFQACYSTHSSLTEIWDMVSYLQPKTLYANVIAEGKTEEEVLKWLLPLLNDAERAKREFQMPALGLLLKTTTEESASSSLSSLNFEYNAQLDLEKLDSSLEYKSDQSDREAFENIEEIRKSPESEYSMYISDSQKTTEPSSSEIELTSEEECIVPLNSSLDFPTNVSLRETGSSPINNIPVWKCCPLTQSELDELDKDTYEYNNNRDCYIKSKQNNQKSSETDVLIDSEGQSASERNMSFMDSSQIKYDSSFQPEEFLEKHAKPKVNASNVTSSYNSTPSPLLVSSTSSKDNSLYNEAVISCVRSDRLHCRSETKLFCAQEGSSSCDMYSVDRGSGLVLSNNDGACNQEWRTVSVSNSAQNENSKCIFPLSDHKSTSPEVDSNGSPSLIHFRSPNSRNLSNVSKCATREIRNSSKDIFLEVSDKQNQTSSFNEENEDNYIESPSLIEFNAGFSSGKKDFDASTAQSKRIPCITIGSDTDDETVPISDTFCDTRFHFSNSISSYSKKAKFSCKEGNSEGEVISGSLSLMQSSSKIQNVSAIPIITLDDE